MVILKISFWTMLSSFICDVSILVHTNMEISISFALLFLLHSIISHTGSLTHTRRSVRLIWSYINVLTPPMNCKKPAVSYVSLRTIINVGKLQTVFMNIHLILGYKVRNHKKYLDLFLIRLKSLFMVVITDVMRISSANRI